MHIEKHFKKNEMHIEKHFGHIEKHSSMCQSVLLINPLTKDTQSVEASYVFGAWKLPMCDVC